MTGKEPRELDRVTTEALNGLIIKHEGDLGKIVEFLGEQGIKTNRKEISARIFQIDALGKLSTKHREIRQERERKERMASYTDKEGLTQLLKIHEGNVAGITRYLKGQKKKVNETIVSRLIKELGLDELRTSEASKRTSAKQLSGAPVKEEILPLSKEEIVLLVAYEKGDSLEVLADKTEMPARRIENMIDSILFKKQVATFDEAKAVVKLVPRVKV